MSNLAVPFGRPQAKIVVFSMVRGDAWELGEWSGGLAQQILVDRVWLHSLGNWLSSYGVSDRVAALITC